MVEILEQTDVSEAIAEQLHKHVFTPDVFEWGHELLCHGANAGLGFRFPWFPRSDSVVETAPLFVFLRRLLYIVYDVLIRLVLYFIAMKVSVWVRQRRELRAREEKIRWVVENYMERRTRPRRF